MVKSEQDIAIMIYNDNYKIIQEELLEKGFMFEDQINCILTRPVRKIFKELISERLGVPCANIEHKVSGEWRGIFFLCDRGLSIDFCRELLETRYK